MPHEVPARERVKTRITWVLSVAMRNRPWTRTASVRAAWNWFCFLHTLLFSLTLSHTHARTHKSKQMHVQLGYLRAQCIETHLGTPRTNFSRRMIWRFVQRVTKTVFQRVDISKGFHNLYTNKVVNSIDLVAEEWSLLSVNELGYHHGQGRGFIVANNFWGLMCQNHDMIIRHAV